MLGRFQVPEAHGFVYSTIDVLEIGIAAKSHLNSMAVEEALSAGAQPSAQDHRSSVFW